MSLFLQFSLLLLVCTFEEHIIILNIYDIRIELNKHFA